MKFYKYHAHGNDYIVIPVTAASEKLTTEQLRHICHRHYGIGGDGIVIGPFPSKSAKCAIKIYNSDGGEATISGNGIRIFSRYLYDNKLVGNRPFTLETISNTVTVKVMDQGRLLQVDMGRVSFMKDDIPVRLTVNEIINQKITVADRTFTFTGATIGNPHCAIVLPEISEKMARIYGPLLENHPYFPLKTNVEFIRVIDRNNIQIELWERGSGYTLSSGSLSSAAASVVRKLDLCDENISAHMPGGIFSLYVNDEFDVRLTGPVTKVSEGVISKEIFTPLTAPRE